jgi:peptide/nickel transport system substrate-binding protein
MGEIWKPILAQIGITLNIKLVTNDVWNQDCCTTPGHGANIMTSNWPPTYPTPYDYLQANFTKDGAGGMGTYWDSPTDDALLDQGQVQSASDKTAAAATFAKVQQDLLTNAVAIPIVDLYMNEGVSADLSGFKVQEASFWIYGLRTTSKT